MAFLFAASGESSPLNGLILLGSMMLVAYALHRRSK
jgi:hypothetical protein